LDITIDYILFYFAMNKETYITYNCEKRDCAYKNKRLHFAFKFKYKSIFVHFLSVKILTSRATRYL